MIYVVEAQKDIELDGEIRQRKTKLVTDQNTSLISRQQVNCSTTSWYIGMMTRLLF